MLITGLRAKNFGCHAQIDMKFKSGLNGTLGQNGSGKSTVLDAIRFGITNESIAAGQRADNLRLGQKSGFVEVDFSHCGEDYTVRRSLENSRCKMTCGEKVWAKASEIDEHLEQLLQTKIDALLNNVFVGQHALDDILFKTNTERLKEFQDTFGLTRMAEAYRVLSTEISASSVTPGLEAQRDLLVAAARDAHKEMAVAEIELRDVTAKISDLMGVSEKVVVHESLVQLRDSRDKALRVMVTLDAEVKTLEKHIAEITVQIGELRLESANQAGHVIAAMTISGSHASAKAQRQTLTDELSRLVAVQPPTEPSADLQAELDKSAERLQKLEAMSKGELPLPQLPGDAELTTEYNDLASKITADIGADIHMLEGDLARELGVLKTFASGSCPTCLRPMDNFNPAAQQKKVDDVREALQAAKAARAERISLMMQRQASVSEELVKRKAAALASVNKALNGVRSDRHTLSQRVGNARKAEASYTAAQTRKVEVEDLLRNVPVISDESALAAAETVRANTERMTRLTDLQTKLSVSESKLTSIQAERGRVLSSMPQVDGSGLMSDEEYAKAKAMELEMNKLFATKRDVETRLGVAGARVHTQEQTVVQLNEQIEKESKAAVWSRLCSRARDIIHVSGLPTLMMKEYAARINKRVAYYLQVWEAPFRLFLDDSLSFRAIFDTGHELPAARLSGGQKIVASTSFRLAMSDTFAKNVGLLILDEPTNHLDKENVVHLQQLLVKLKQTAGASQRQIIIVTHEEQLVGFFDHTIQLAKLT